MIFRARDRRRLMHGTFEDQEVAGDFRNGLAFKSTFKNVWFDDCRMERMLLSGSTFSNCIFRNCHLDCADLSHSIFTGCDFFECSLDQANFGGGILKNCQFSGGRAEYAVFQDAVVEDTKMALQLHGADLRFASSKNVSFEDANLWGAHVRLSCAQFLGNAFSERELEVFLALLARTAGNDKLRARILELVSPESRALVDRLTLVGVEFGRE